MADGETHLRYLNYGWIIIIPLSIFVFGVVYKYSLHPYLYPIFIYFNYWICRYQDPDDDQSSMTSSEGRLQRDTKRVNILFGFIGAIANAYKVIYAYIAGIFGGHRCWFSHGWIIGALIRQIYYDAILADRIYSMLTYIVPIWHWTNIYYELYLDIWLIPFLISQSITWIIADTIHIILDQKWAIGVLYKPIPKNNRR